MATAEISPYHDPAYWFAPDTTPVSGLGMPNALSDYPRTDRWLHEPAFLSSIRTYLGQLDAPVALQAYPDGQEIDLRDMPGRSFIAWHEMLCWGDQYVAPSLEACSAPAPQPPLFDKQHLILDPAPAQKQESPVLQIGPTLLQANQCIYVSNAYSVVVGSRRNNRTWPYVSSIGDGTHPATPAIYIERTFHQPHTVGQSVYNWDDRNGYFSYSRISGLWAADYSESHVNALTMAQALRIILDGKSRETA